MLTWIIAGALGVAILVSILGGIYGGVNDFIAQRQALNDRLSELREKINEEETKLASVKQLVRGEINAICEQNSVGFIDWHQPDRYAAALKMRHSANLLYREYILDCTDEDNSAALDLNRDMRLNSGDAQIGQEYEKHVADIYRNDGYDVEMYGRNQGLSDHGCDLIARNIKSEEVHIIQCKRWAQNRQIHENVVCQLYGTSAAFQRFNCFNIVLPVLISTHYPSSEAARFADLLGIEIRVIPDPASHANNMQIL